MTTTKERPDVGQATGPTPLEFVDRLMGAALGWAEVNALYLGDRLGWYRDLAIHGPSTHDELAARTGTSPRYAREWLEQQAITGIIVADDATDGEQRRYRLAPGPTEVLTDQQSLAYFAPFARMAGAVGRQLPDLVRAYRDGTGISWAEFGVDAREGQAEMNRPWLAQLPGVLGNVPQVHSALSRPGARIADVGTGAGWSAIAMAQAHPGLRADGFDVDEPSVALARANAEQAGVSDRVRFHLADGDSLASHGHYDAVFAFECLHDMPRPVDVLRSMREAVADDGVVVVMDERVGDSFTSPGELDALFYAFSIFLCLPDSMSHRPSAATGTVMRPDVLRDYARAAGFDDVSVLPIEDFGLWRFYELTF
ncbi:class I SAM-dependent methyltransferase [Tessaracoccus terricola]